MKWLVAIVFVSFLASLGCSHAAADCQRSLTEFRATMRDDITMASAPAEALTLARAHRGDTSEDCTLANTYADQSENARLHPAAASPVASASSTPVPPAEAFVPAGGSPRVHLVITPPPGSTETPRASAQPTPPPIHEAATRAPAGIVETKPTPSPEKKPVTDGAPTPDPLVACKAACDSVANFQARVACVQRCEGATPLPDAFASPTIR